jgi:hypothetical protein
MAEFALSLPSDRRFRGYRARRQGYCLVADRMLGFLGRSPNWPDQDL